MFIFKYRKKIVHKYRLKMFYQGGLIQKEGCNICDIACLSLLPETVFMSVSLLYNVFLANIKRKYFVNKYKHIYNRE